MSADNVLASGPQREAAIAARQRYWRSLGDDARAEAVPSPVSLLAWEDVVAELSPQAVIRTARPSEAAREALRLAGEVERLTAHLRTCEAARANAEVHLAELEAAVSRPAPALFRHLPDTGDVSLCDSEHTRSDTLPVCPACHHVKVQQLQARVAELERSLRELAPAPAFRHLYRQEGDGTQCGLMWTQKFAEAAAAHPPLPVCWPCVRAALDKAEDKANAMAAEAWGDRQARDQLVQAVRDAIREAVPDA